MAIQENVVDRPTNAMALQSRSYAASASHEGTLGAAQESPWNCGVDLYGASDRVVELRKSESRFDHEIDAEACVLSRCRMQIA